MSKAISLYTFVTNDLTTDQRMQRICASLASSGYQVSLIGRAKKHSADFMPSNYKYHRFSCMFNNGLLFYLELNIRIIIFCFRKRPDIVYACDPDTLLGTVLYKTIFRKKGVYDAHEYYIESPELLGRNVVRKVWDVIETTFAPKMDIFITVNETLQSILSKRLNVSFQTIRNVPVNNTNNLNLNRQKIIIYQGVINKGREIQLMLDALQYLEDYQLWIVGNGDKYQSLCEYSDTLPYANRIKWYGAIAPEKLRKLTPLARFGYNLLDPSSKNYKYSLANKFFDYMAAGVPSLNSALPLYQDYCSNYECGIIINENSLEHLVSTINRIDEDQDSYLKMQKNALNAHKMLNWEKEEKVLLEILAEHK